MQGSIFEALLFESYGWYRDHLRFHTRVLPSLTARALAVAPQGVLTSRFASGLSATCVNLVTAHKRNKSAIIFIHHHDWSTTHNFPLKKLRVSDRGRREKVLFQVWCGFGRLWKSQYSNFHETSLFLFESTAWCNKGCTSRVTCVVPSIKGWRHKLMSSALVTMIFWTQLFKFIFSFSQHTSFWYFRLESCTNSGVVWDLGTPYRSPLKKISISEIPSLDFKLYIATVVVEFTEHWVLLLAFGQNSRPKYNFTKLIRTNARFCLGFSSRISCFMKLGELFETWNYDRKTLQYTKTVRCQPT